MSGPRPPFDPAQELRPGVTVLEASAGTGKTYQISTLVARLVAEAGVPIDEILVVTFTRAATRELVDRVRGRLGEALHAVRDPAPPKDPALARLWDLQRNETPVASRLHQALQRFDQATILTIHGFCQRILKQNAFESLADGNAELVSDDRPLREEIRDDLLARIRYEADGTQREFLDGTPASGGCGLSGAPLDQLVNGAVGHRDAPVEPMASAGVLAESTGIRELSIPSDPLAMQELAGRVRADVARYARRELEERSRDRRLRTYDDLLRLLARSLGHDAPADRRARLTEAVRQQFKAALIDEFQDTDRVQWTIFRSLFDHLDHYLYLIGDPKQAIYGFRGANVHVYLEAVRTAGEDAVFTMGRNYRSDARLVQALNHLWNHPGIFGDSEIAYVPVDAQHPQDRLLPPPHWDPADPRRGALQLRFFDGSLSPFDGPQVLLSPTAAAGILEDRLAEDVVQALGEGWRFAEGGRALGPGDVAVLVRGHRQAHGVQRALAKRGVPSVRSGADNVFASDEAHHLQAWLAAVVEPGRESPARRAAATPLFGWGAADLARLGQEIPETVERWDHWLASLHTAGATFERRGFMVACRGAMDTHDVLPRLLRWPDGERRVTNLLHLAELIHSAQQAERLAPMATLHWLTEERARAHADPKREAGEAELRLERDDEAVHILTMHKSKGLQFPVVFAPDLWNGRRLRDPHPLVVPDPEDRSRRRVLTTVDDTVERRAGLLDEARRDVGREKMRLAYVALTRARHRAYVYGGPYKPREGPEGDYRWSALSALLHAPPESTDRPEAPPEHALDPTQLWRDVEAVAEGAPIWDGSPTIGASRCAPPGLTPWAPPETPETAKLLARRYERGPFDGAWRLHSYTSLTRGQEPGTLRAPDPVAEAGGGDDAPEDSPTPDPTPADAHEPDVPLAGFAAGARAGTFLHSVFEHLDFEPGDDDDPLRSTRAAIEAQSRRYGFRADQVRGLAEPLAETLRVPLGGPLGSFQLCQLSRADRLDELRFSLPMAPMAGQDLAYAFAADPGAGGLDPEYLKSVRALNFGPLAGFLTGAIDLIFRHDGRYYVADYKSNRLDPKRTGRSPLSHYTRPFMQAEMEHHHYLLQAHLYALALHRFLGHRMGARYRYETHFGGAVYLFLRGMTHPGLPVDARGRPGVYHIRPAPAVIDALDRCFGRPGEARP